MDSFFVGPIFHADDRAAAMHFWFAIAAALSSARIDYSNLPLLFSFFFFFKKNRLVIFKLFSSCDFLL
jgi:hypothetical protein